jgi:malonyl-CoA O-methyltransferase
VSLARARARTADADGRSRLGRLMAAMVPARSDAPGFVCADAERLPLRNASVDLVWSNLALQWLTDPRHALAEFHRVLRVDGLASFTTFGPDTLRELRAAFAEVDGRTHVSRFLDMHDVGDVLVHCGFADPVMDMEKITVTYADATALMRDLKAIGANNATAGRPRGLTGRAHFSRVTAALDRMRRDGRLPVTFEVIYGHAWKPAPKVADDGRAIVRFRSSR